MLAPPGYAKMVSTPACSRAWTRRSQPMVGADNLVLLGATFLEDDFAFCLLTELDNSLKKRVILA